MACGCKAKQNNKSNQKDGVFYLDQTVNQEDLVVLEHIYNPTGSTMQYTVNGRIYIAGGSVRYVLAKPEDVAGLLAKRFREQIVFSITTLKYNWGLSKLE